LSENILESTLASKPFLLERHYPRVSEVAISPGRRTSCLGENNPESILVPQNYSRLAEMLSLGRNMQRTTTSTALELTCMPHMIKIIRINTLIQ